MATSSDAQRGGMDSFDVAGSGWLTFAATLLGLAGTFNITSCAPDLHPQ